MGECPVMRPRLRRSLPFEDEEVWNTVPTRQSGIRPLVACIPLTTRLKKGRSKEQRSQIRDGNFRFFPQIPSRPPERAMGFDPTSLDSGDLT